MLLSEYKVRLKESCRRLENIWFDLCLYHHVIGYNISKYSQSYRKTVKTTTLQDSMSGSKDPFQSQDAS